MKIKYLAEIEGILVAVQYDTEKEKILLGGKNKDFLLVRSVAQRLFGVALETVRVSKAKSGSFKMEMDYAYDGWERALDALRSIGYKLTLTSNFRGLLWQ